MESPEATAYWQRIELYSFQNIFVSVYSVYDEMGYLYVSEVSTSELSSGSCLCAVGKDGRERWEELPDGAHWNKHLAPWISDLSIFILRFGFARLFGIKSRGTCYFRHNRWIKYGEMYRNLTQRIESCSVETIFRFLCSFCWKIERDLKECGPELALTSERSLMWMRSTR